MRYILRFFLTRQIEAQNHLVKSYRNKISEWAVGFRYGNFTLKLARRIFSLESEETQIFYFNDKTESAAMKVTNVLSFA